MASGGTASGPLEMFVASCVDKGAFCSPITRVVAMSKLGGWFTNKTSITNSLYKRECWIGPTALSTTETVQLPIRMGSVVKASVPFRANATSTKTSPSKIATSNVTEDPKYVRLDTSDAKDGNWHACSLH
eukprot:3055815-Rhodomonas_salina.1